MAAWQDGAGTHLVQSDTRTCGTGHWAGSSPKLPGAASGAQLWLCSQHPWARGEAQAGQGVWTGLHWAGGCRACAGAQPCPWAISPGAAQCRLPLPASWGSHEQCQVSAHGSPQHLAGPGELMPGEGSTGVSHQLVPWRWSRHSPPAWRVEVVGRVSSAPGAARHFCLRQVNPTVTCSSALLVCIPWGSPHPLALHMLRVSPRALPPTASSSMGLPCGCEQPC